MISLPGYFQDPFVGKTQNDLYDMGSKLMSGNIPSYFKPIGEIGGPELENVISMATRDTSKALTEHAARVGNRGGINRLAPAIADTSTNLRYQDLLRALQGRAGFLNTGSEMLGGVRSAAITEGANRNSFDMEKAKLTEESSRYEQQRADAKKAARNAMYTQILSAGIGGASNLYGMGILSKALSAGGTAAAGAGTASVTKDMFAPNFFDKY